MEIILVSELLWVFLSFNLEAAPTMCLNHVL